MKIAVVTEAEKVEFQRFAFHHFRVGNVADEDGGEIGLAGHRAQAGEFGADEFDEIVVAGVFVVERFQYFGRVAVGILRAAAQKGQAAQLVGRTGHEGFLSFLLWEGCEPHWIKEKRRIVRETHAFSKAGRVFQTASCLLPQRAGRLKGQGSMCGQRGRAAQTGFQTASEFKLQ